MFGFFLVEALVALVIGYSVWWYVARKPKNFPPGPWGFPFIGYVPFMAMNLGEQFMNLGKKYGPIISFDRGPIKAVMLNDYNTIKKTFSDNNFVGISEASGEVFLSTGDSFMSQDGQKWHEGRRFALTTLRDFGMGKSSMEPKMLDEISHFMDYLKEQKGKPCDMTGVMALSVSNIGTLMMMNKRYDYTDEERLEVRRMITEVFRQRLYFLILPVFPELVKYGLHKWIPGYNMQKQCRLLQEKMLKDILEEHKKNHYPGKCDDYIDAFLCEKEERSKKNNNPEFFDDNTLMSDIRVLSLVANDTVSFFLTWGFLYLIAHPDIQRKMQAELDRVIGRQRSPSMADRPNLPYTEAFMTELFRRSPLLPFLDAKIAKADATIEGYDIPKGTHVFGNLWSNHFDEKTFPDPESFRPERFLDSEGNYVKPTTLLNFGLGKRNCIAETLGRMVLYLYLTSVVQNFTLLQDDHVTVTPDATFAIIAKAQKIRAIERKSE